jgi:hypothetical protein
MLKNLDGWDKAAVAFVFFGALFTAGAVFEIRRLLERAVDILGEISRKLTR